MSKSNKVELKSCPFCGGEATLLKAKDDNDFDTICCRGAYCELWDTFTVEQWNTRHNEMVELDEESVYAIMKKPITTDEMVKEICAKFGQRQTEDRMPSSTNAKWCIDRLNEAKLNVNEIGDKFHFDNKVVVHLNVINRTIECLSLINYDEEENVDDLVEACVGLLAMRRIKKSNSKYDEYYQRFEQAIARFKEKKD